MNVTASPVLLDDSVTPSGGNHRRPHGGMESLGHVCSVLHSFSEQPLPGGDHFNSNTVDVRRFFAIERDDAVDWCEPPDIQTSYGDRNRDQHDIYRQEPGDSEGQGVAATCRIGQEWPLGARGRIQTCGRPRVGGYSLRRRGDKGKDEGKDKGGGGGPMLSGKSQEQQERRPFSSWRSRFL